jgi:hypothetical protein
MMSNVAMGLLVAMYLGITAFTVATMHTHGHVDIAAAAFSLSR